MISEENVKQSAVIQFCVGLRNTPVQNYGTIGKIRVIKEIHSEIISIQMTQAVIVKDEKRYCRMQLSNDKIQGM
jgi:hypothetical protein